MNIYIVIPAHNEEEYLPHTLQSLVEQTFRPSRLIVVNDNSTDKTEQIINSFVNNYDFIDSVNLSSNDDHAPGSKVIQAFNSGLNKLNADYDVICKFDADLIFPKNYLETIANIFKSEPKCGMAGGFCHIENNGSWELENLTNRDHIRGALKAYRKDCFEQIGGLKSAMGWDTIDELLAKYNGWQVITTDSLQVKHMKPTGKIYSRSSRFKQGEAFYKMRYGFILSLIAAAKLGIKKRSVRFFTNTLHGYISSSSKKLPYLVSIEEGKFIRQHRWNGIRKKMLG